MWSNYDSAEFEGADDQWWDEDVYLAQSVQHLLTVTDEYLNDHTKLSAENDERKYWDRVLWSTFTGENITLEIVPEYLTPDKDRGVVYSDELIEMKGKTALYPMEADPVDAYVNDTFTHNEELDMTNKIGTIRVQYDWKPDLNLAHEIEEDKLARIAPLLNYVNHAAILRSTKVCTVNTVGQVKNLVLCL